MHENKCATHWNTCTQILRGLEKLLKWIEWHLTQTRLESKQNGNNIRRADPLFDGAFFQ